MAEEKAEVRTLPVKLTAAEIRAHERAIPQLLTQIDTKKTELKAAAAEGAAHLKTLAREVSERREAAVSGIEQRPVPCTWRVRGDRRELVRDDTREVVEAVSLSAKEVMDRRQRKLFEESEAIQVEETLSQLVAFVGSFDGKVVSLAQVVEAFAEYRESALSVTLDKLAEAGRLVRMLDGWRVEVAPAPKDEPKPDEGQGEAAP